MKNVKLWLLLLVLGGCALAENIQKEESKDYIDTVHDVELVDYEFEERLNSFYESEPIEPQELSDLYEGEFPEGGSNPRELRIHWKDARELALAELELQIDIQNWQDTEISERPILVLDRDGGDFYRYYEYRVLRSSKFVGAIRIPAYRRTENFTTAEVHVYSSDEKTYTIKPTGWANAILSELDLSSSKEEYFKLANKISEGLKPLIDSGELSQETIKQYYQEQVQTTGLIEEMVRPVSEQKVEQYIREFVYQSLTPEAMKQWHIDNAPSPYPNIVEIDADIQDYTADLWVNTYLPTYAQGLEIEHEKFVNDYIVDYMAHNSTILLGEEIARFVLISTEEITYQTISNMQFTDKPLSQEESIFAKTFKDKFWDKAETYLDEDTSTYSLIGAIVASIILGVGIDIYDHYSEHNSLDNIDYESLIFNAIVNGGLTALLPGGILTKEILQSVGIIVISKILSEISDEALPNSGALIDWVKVLALTIASNKEVAKEVIQTFVRELTLYIKDIVTDAPITPPTGGGEW